MYPVNPNRYRNDNHCQQVFRTEVMDRLDALRDAGEQHPKMTCLRSIVAERAPASIEFKKAVLNHNRK